VWNIRAILCFLAVSARAKWPLDFLQIQLDWRITAEVLLPKRQGSNDSKKVK